MKRSYFYELNNFLSRISEYIEDLLLLGFYKEKKGLIQSINTITKLLYLVLMIALVFALNKISSIMILLAVSMILFYSSKIPVYRYLTRLLILLGPLILLISSPYILLGRDLFNPMISLNTDRLYNVALLFLRSLYIALISSLVFSTVSISDIHDLLRIRNSCTTQKLSVIILILYRSLHKYLRDQMNKIVALNLRIYSDSLREVWRKQISFLARSLIRDIEYSYLLEKALRAREISVNKNYELIDCLEIRYRQDINSDRIRLVTKLSSIDYVFLLLAVLIMLIMLFIDRGISF